MREPVVAALAALVLAALLPGCATLSGARPTPKATRGVELLRAIDRGETSAPITEGMKGVFPHSLAGFAAEWRSSHGALVEAQAAGRDDDGAELVDATYASSPFSERIKLAFDGQGRLAGLWYLGAGSGAMDAPALARAFAAIPGQVSAFAQAAEHREVQLGYRASEPQPVASQYKVLLLARACGEVGRGTRSLDDRLTLPARVRGLPSCVLCQFDPGLNPTLRDVLHLLVASSDNTAADLLREELGVDAVERFAAQNGVAHLPALLGTQGLFALECGLGPLRAKPVAERAGWLARLSPAELLAAGDEAARDGFAEGVAGFGPRCVEASSDGDSRSAIAHVADWNLRADELVALYTNAQLGQLDSPAASACFLDFMGHSGPAPLTLDAQILAVGAKNGIEADVRSLGLVVKTDRGPIAVSLSAMQFPEAQADRELGLLYEGARALVGHLYARLPPARP